VTPTVVDSDDRAEPAAVGDLTDVHAPAPSLILSPCVPTSPAQRLGAFDQQSRRDSEHAARRRAAELGRDLLRLGWAWGRVGEWLGVAGRTIRHWCFRLLDRLRPACPLGRPATRSSREQRNAVIDLLDEFGPQFGVPALRECFPAMSRAELDDLVKRYRRVWRERHRQPLRVLEWPIPGRVWAIDFAEPPAPVDGRFGHLLAVRDLATGMPLLWRPVEAATASEATDGLAGLFAEHGPPLVLKSDNGSHFTGGAVPDLLAAHWVEHLLSPPYWPRYNGAVEAGIHALKDRTAARAARAGHPGFWTQDDTAGALAETAELARPHGPAGPSPAAAWTARVPIPAAERDAFAARVGHQSTCGLPVGEVWSGPEVARAAIRHALEERGYLQYRRRRILPPITGRNAASHP
jgi:transposase InsO family protein